MRTILPALQDKLDSGATTLCRCYKLVRRDGLVQGFTDHDEDLVIDDVVCRFGTGLSASEATAKLGLSIDGMEISGALSDDSLTEADLAAGRYDKATVETWLGRLEPIHYCAFCFLNVLSAKCGATVWHFLPNFVLCQTD